MNLFFSVLKGASAILLKIIMNAWVLKQSMHANPLQFISLGVLPLICWQGPLHLPELMTITFLSLFQPLS